MLKLEDDALYLTSDLCHLLTMYVAHASSDSQAVTRLTRADELSIFA
jgi:hypothetical protein